MSGHDTPAFPTQRIDGIVEDGINIRDYFATKFPADEIQELTYRSLSRQAQERLVGMPYPVNPDTVGGAQVTFQLAEFEFKCLVNAAIRYKLADAMLTVRAA